MKVKTTTVHNKPSLYPETLKASDVPKWQIFKKGAFYYFYATFNRHFTLFFFECHTFLYFALTEFTILFNLTFRRIS